MRGAPLAASLLIPSRTDLAALAVELVLTAGICAVLLVPLVFRTRANVLASAAATAAVAVGFLLTFAAPSGSGTAFAGMIVFDGAALLWRRIALLFVLGVLIARWPRGDDTERDDTVDCTLLLSATVGMTLMGATANLLLVLLASELASVASYLLAGLRKHERLASEAALKFVLVGAVSTAVMAYGISLLYGVTGSFDFAAIAAHLSAGSVSPLAVMGLVGLLVGLLFKLSAVPMHFWAPDVFQGGGVDVAAFLSVVSKGAGVVLLARLVALLVAPGAPLIGGTQFTLAIIAIATMTVGNVAALPQTSVKRMLGYSTIAQGGYLLAAVALIGPAGFEATAIYLMVYAAMNLGAFAVLASVEAARRSDHVDAFNGLARLAPASAAAMAVCLIALIGLPPTAGFFAKWKIMSALAAGGGWWWAAVAAVALNSVISVAYYARLIRAMYLRSALTSAGENLAPPGWSPATWVGVASAIALVAGLVLFTFVERAAARFTFGS
ncbi:MAG TPA: NADH-quinone oxidoreductase subunit N [Tepidisphaeraceae bacterium]